MLSFFIFLWYNTHRMIGKERDPLQKSNITVKDLARLCGVSIGTVDRAINDRRGISKETRDRILETARAYGFVKNQSASSLSSGRSNTIGVIIFNLKSEYFADALSAIEEEARREGYNTMIMLSGYDAETEMECARRMTAIHIAGLIVFSVLKDPSFYVELQNNGTPVVALGNPIGGGIPFVGIDDRAAMRTSCQYVLSRGYERVLYVAPLLEKAKHQNIAAQSLRYAGFLDAIEGTNTSYTVIDTYDTYRTHFPTLDSAKTALICPSDTYTLHCLELFYDQTPTVGIMGFDRFLTLGRLLPRLSGITYSYHDIGAAAVHVLLADQREDVLLPFTLIPGETV